jgi:hypothetical protein
MPYIEMVVPLNFKISEPLVVAPILPAEERPTKCYLKSYDLGFTIPTVETGEVRLTEEIWEKIKLISEYFSFDLASRGKSVIKIRCAKPLRPQNKT